MKRIPIYKHVRCALFSFLFFSAQIESFQTRLIQPHVTKVPNEKRSQQYFNQAHRYSLAPLKLSPIEDDDYFDVGNSLSLIAGQSLLIGLAVIGATLLKIPNLGLGPGISFSSGALVDGILKTTPLVLVAYLLDFVEKDIPALQNVTKATQQMTLSILGGKFKPVVAILVSIALGLAAGIGEEMLFRGILQYELQTKLNDILSIGLSNFLSLGLTAVIFGLLHAVTPIYALLATIAGAYFGWLYQAGGNLAVPITTHTVYDIGAFFYAHWTVAKMTKEEQIDIAAWDQD